MGLMYLYKEVIILIKNMPKEELEILSYTDLTELILKEENKSLNTPTIFKKICDLLDYDDSEFTNKIGEYYTALATDKRFVFLENNEWDLREKNPVDIVLDDEEDIDEEIEEEIEESDEEIEEDINSVLEDDELEDDEELDDLAILTDEELDDN